MMLPDEKNETNEGIHGKVEKFYEYIIQNNMVSDDFIISSSFSFTNSQLNIQFTNL